MQQTKTEEELKKEQEEARKELDELFKKSKPKNLADGLGQGVNSIVGGALGGVGIAVLAPAAGFTEGMKRNGVLGGVAGATGGLVVGAIGGVGLILGGAVSGVTQIVRGAAAQPTANKAKKEGKWWNENTHEWVLTNLKETSVPENDDDLLKKIVDDLDSSPGQSSLTVEVKDTLYYDTLEVDPSADPSAIKRKYYLLARKYHPDKVGQDDKESAEKFKQIAEAYQVLSDPKLRQQYDKDGRDGLSGDKTDVNGGGVDPSILMAFLFGSDKFNDYFGRLATSTSAMLGDSAKLSGEDSRILQDRRCTRLAIKLAKKVEPWLKDDFEMCQTVWATEAVELSKASFGYELVKVLGMAYEVTALQFLGSTESGIGMPSIGKWAAGQKAKRKQKKAGQQTQVEGLRATFNAMQLQEEYQRKIKEAKTPEEKARLEKELEDATQSSVLSLIWTATVVDITATIHETCQMLFFDQSVDKDLRKKRAYAVKNLGLALQACSEPIKPKQDAKNLFEEAALAAMVETMKRKDEESFSASFRNK
jgi:DnaJ-domain-containing protein 1